MMAHFAEIEADTGMVLRVVRVPDDQEHRGSDYLAFDLALGGEWIQTWYDHGGSRRRHAAPGRVYDRQRDVFLMPQPFPSWTQDEEGEWQPPVAQPEGDPVWWSEADGAWLPMRPFPSWLFDETEHMWFAPLPYPEDGLDYEWDEEVQRWVLIVD